MVRFILEDSNKHLILLIHGFTGGKETWVEKEGDRIPKYLSKNKEISSNFDIAYFEYFTKFSDKIERIRGSFLFKGGARKRFKKNLSIDDIKDILFSHLEVEFKKYDKIILIAHSMGGLISKAAILKLIENNNHNKIALFISLCVPNNGSNLANLGRFILNNPNLKDLAPLSNIIDTTNRKWINQSIVELLPETIYFQGKNDTIVPKESSIGYESRDIQIVYSDDDHSSILSPNSSKSIVMKSITYAILDTLKKKASNKKLLINAEISEDSLKKIADKIGNKLGVNAPNFENQIYNKDRIPQLSSHISRRTTTIKNLLSESDKKWIAIYGMYDTGKTQLSILIHQVLALETVWISFRECDEKTIIKKLFASFEASKIEELEINLNTICAKKRILIVLDDLPKFGIIERVDDVFNTFISRCLHNDVTILSTSNHLLANSIKTLHNDNIYEKRIPLLNETECEEVIQTYPDSINFEHKNLLYTITEGYPIYLQVVCRYLQNSNWVIKEEEFLNFFSGELFTNLTDETLSKFVLKVEDEQTRELLYRLNIVRSNITDNEIRVVADCTPNITKPLEKIMEVIGSWLQKDQNNYIISPLFNRLGAKNLPDSLIIDINYELGKLLLSKKNLSQFEVQHVISYFKNSKKYDKAGFVVLKFLQHSFSQPNLFFDWGFEFHTWYYTPIPTQMSLMLRLFIRSLHLNLESTKLNQGNDNLEFLRNDLAQLVDLALDKKLDVYFPALVLSSSYLREDSGLSIKYFSHYLNSYTYKQLPEIATAELDEVLEFDNNIIWLLLFNIDDMFSLQQWFSNIETMGKSIDELDYEQAFLFSEKLFNNFIFKEEKSDDPKWSSLVDIFDQIFKKANELKIEILKAFAIKKQIFILSEKLDDLNAAENAFNQHKNLLNEKTSIFLATDELGKQYYYKENKNKAREYLLQIVDFEVDKYITVKADTYLTLAKTIDSVDTKNAHSYMEKGLAFVTDNIFVDEISYVQFTGEFATSLFLLGDSKGSLLKFIEGYELLLDSFEENTTYINTQVRYGNAIGYILYFIETGKLIVDGYTKPYRGFISNNNDLKDLFFPEKLLINIFNIIHFFEITNDKVRAEYWAYKMFDLKKKYGMKVFHRMLSNLLGYRIVKGEFEEVFEQQIEIRNLTNEMLLRDTELIVHPEEKKLVISIQERESEQTKDFGFDLVMLVLNPIIIHLLTKRLKNELKTPELVNISIDLLDKYSANFDNKDLLSKLNYIISHCPTNQSESKNLLEYLEKVSQDIFGYLQVLTYLICSLQMSSKVAIETYFLMTPTFGLYKGSINNYVLIPFLIEFWKKKLDDEPQVFNNSAKLYENLRKVTNLNIDLQIKAIFALVAEQLNYNLKDVDISWLKDYTDEFGE